MGLGEKRMSKELFSFLLRTDSETFAYVKKDSACVWVPDTNDRPALAWLTNADASKLIKQIDFRYAEKVTGNPCIFFTINMIKYKDGVIYKQDILRFSHEPDTAPPIKWPGPLTKEQFLRNALEILKKERFPENIIKEFEDEHFKKNEDK